MNKTVEVVFLGVYLDSRRPPLTVVKDGRLPRGEPVGCSLFNTAQTLLEAAFGRKATKHDLVMPTPFWDDLPDRLVVAYAFYVLAAATPLPPLADGHAWLAPQDLHRQDQDAVLMTLNFHAPTRV